MRTEKIYYADMFKKECEATITDVQDNKIVCSRTVAFPEGGGQIGDCGYIIYDGDKYVKFIDTKKGVGDIVHLNERYTIQVNTPVYHIVQREDAVKLSVGMKVKIVIDVRRRIKTTAMHSALHIVLMAAVKIRQELDKRIKGCHIEEEKARIDFFCEEKFSAEDIEEINKIANDIVKENDKIERYLYNGINEAWIWKCRDFECPCGGTHLLSAGQIKGIRVKRKNVGKTTERLIVTVEEILLTEDMYHK